MAVAGLIFISGVLNLALSLSSAGSLSSFLLSAAAAVSVVPLYTSLILWIDRHEREPGWLLLAAFFWGAAVATLLAGVANTVGAMLLRAALGPDLARRLTPPFLAPLTEETAKGAAVLLIAVLWRHEFHNTLDGVVYGALAGLGFAVVENVDYFLRALRQEGLAGLAASFYARALVGGLGHSAYTACTGAGIGYARESGTRAARLAGPLLGFACAVFLHFAWNFSATYLDPWLRRLTGGNPWLDLLVVLPLTWGVLEAPAWVTLGVIAYLSWKREVWLVRTHLADEDPSTTPDLQELLSPRRRLRRLWHALLTGGVGSWWDLRTYYDLCIDFAFAKFDVRRGERPAHDLEAYRARLQELRRRIGRWGYV
ncbi:MAG: PrsW family intramembrane metalloprotease [Armatimonadota bacterium]|nr:PrsW family intramembrane metalloprotease [Armatimonadota bacterium]MDW8155388.1 PrsW family intramembrane metalloprotease [Armatimonadota bacterium]